MVKKTTVILIDDLDDSEADETIKFGLDGVNYEIDLSSDNSGELRDILAQYVENGRRVSGRKSSSGRRRRTKTQTHSPSINREQNQAIRSWAREKGYEISERGRIPSEIAEAYFQEKG